MWELQSNMHSWIAPSVFKAHEENQTDAEDFKWITERYADQRWDEDLGPDDYDRLVKKCRTVISNLGGSVEAICYQIADRAIEYSSTTIGGFEVHLDSHNSIPWCTEDEMQTWYA